MNGQGFSGFAQSLCKYRSACCIGAGENNAKLFPAITARDVDVAQLRSQGAADFTNDIVAHRVSVSIVDLLKVIDVEHDQSRRKLIAVVARSEEHTSELQSRENLV